MTAHSFARLRVVALAACSALALTVTLTGCNMEAHDSIETPAPSSMPTPPPTVKATPKKPTTPVPPPPKDTDMGMPVYPNATTYVDSLGNFIKFDKSGGMALARLQTSDSVDSVIAFYKSKIMQTNSRGQTTPAAPSEEKQDGKRKVVFVGNDVEGNTQMVEVREDEGKTAIELMTTQTKGLPAGLPGANTADDMPGTPSSPAVSPSPSGLPSSEGAVSMPPASGKLP